MGELKGETVDSVGLNGRSSSSFGAQGVGLQLPKGSEGDSRRQFDCRL